MGGCGELLNVHLAQRVESIPYTLTAERLLGDPRASSKPPMELDDGLIYRLKRVTQFLETSQYDQQYWKY